MNTRVTASRPSDSKHVEASRTKVFSSTLYFLVTGQTQGDHDNRDERDFSIEKGNIRDTRL